MSVGSRAVKWAGRRRPVVVPIGMVLPALALALAWHLSTPLSLAVVDGRSMEPTLHPGQLFVIDRLSCRLLPIHRGEVITFHHEADIYVKRVVGVGGDTVWMLQPSDSSPAVIIPGDAVRLMRGILQRHPSIGRLERRDVPKGYLFVAGDHRSVSYDSRDFGPVPVSTVVGRALF